MYTEPYGINGLAKSGLLTLSLCFACHATAQVTLSSSIDSNNVNLTWSYQNFGANYQEIYRDTDSNPSGRIRIATGVQGNHFSDNNRPDGTYYYWIKSRSASGQIVNSNATEATIGSPSVTLTSSVNQATASLSWQYDNFNANYQEVYRDTDSNPSGRVRIASNVAGYSFSESNLSPGTYYYWVKANGNNSTLNSNATEVVIADTTTSITIEEDNASFCGIDEGGAIERAHSGYQGSGYANTENASGEGIEWAIESDQNHTVNVYWRYANGSAADRTANIYINDSYAGNLGFNSTDGWNRFSNTATLNVALNVGNNTIRLEATSSAGLANIDNVNVTGTGISTGGCSLNLGELAAFPGAVGFGKDTIGGRGGDVYHVTNLNDSGLGSLRDAISNNNRTIVFDVAGTIRLESPLKIRHDHLTLAGQTAPGGGITVAGYPTDIEAEHVIVRYMRFRTGDYNALAGNGKPSKGNGDLKANTAGALDVGNSRYVVLDHVSTSWAMDEVLSVTNSNNVTVQYSMVTEALNNSHHEKGTHGYGSLIRAATSGEGYTFYRNLYAHNYGRNPGAGANQTSGNYETLYFDFINNVIYGWGNRSGEVIDGSQGGTVHMNFIGNYAIANQDSRNASSLWDESKTAGILTYQADNKLDNNFDANRDGSNLEWGLFPNFSESQKRTSRWSFPEVPTMTADQAYYEVLNQAGASLVRDAVDNRIVSQVQNTTGGIIDSQDEVGGLPTISWATAASDSDQDGMPDAWETAHGLNPQNANDRNNTSIEGTYTNLEVYLDSLTH